MIRLKNVKKSFGSLTVLDGLTLDLDEGVVAVLGPSGSGKSTVLRCINGLEPIDSGDIEVDGYSVTARGNLRTIRSICGMVFQQFHLFPHLDVLQNITLSPMRIRKKPKGQARDEAMILLEKVGMKDKYRNYPDQLSGGQQQRVAIARALAMNPKMLLLDEVTSALDPEMTADVLKILEKLAEEGTKMILVTHEISFARRVASRVIFLEGGKVAADRPVEEFFTATRDERIVRFLKHVG